MSLKISNGFKIKQLSMNEFGIFVDELKDRFVHYCIPKVQDLYIREIVRMFNNIDYFNLLDNEEEKEKMLFEWERSYFTPIAATMIDVANKKHKTKTLEEVKKNLSYPFVASIEELVYNHITNRAIAVSLSQRNLPAYDFDANMVVYSKFDDFILFTAYGEKYISMLFSILSSKDEKDIAFCKKYELQEYCYIGSCDDDLPEDVAKQRKADWDKAFEKSSLPFMNGFIVEIYNPKTLFEWYMNVFLPRNDVCKLLPTNEKRCYDNAYKICKNEYYIKKIAEKLGKKPEELKGDDCSVSLIMDFSKEWDDRINANDEELLNMVKEKQEELIANGVEMEYLNLSRPIMVFLRNIDL